MSLFRIIELYVIIPLQAFVLIVLMFFFIRWMWRTSKIEKGNAKPAIRKSANRNFVLLKRKGVL